MSAGDRLSPLGGREAQPAAAGAVDSPHQTELLRTAILLVVGFFVTLINEPTAAGLARFGEQQSSSPPARDVPPYRCRKRKFLRFLNLKNQSLNLGHPLRQKDPSK
ncbi:hypothetical protein [Ciceribacter thiooxidans]|uniref:hypothetical protein n=1 Tax=Ciceribacter thiooxidans TaxID=1969821 RepID=UPI0015FCBD9F|nr:hypothetical protein [Ciceribacter thiooxidans]MDI6836156.1 hypothetical protein [Rhizobiaceae bacterium]